MPKPRALTEAQVKQLADSGLSQRAAAAQLGVSPSTISRRFRHLFDTSEKGLGGFQVMVQPDGTVDTESNAAALLKLYREVVFTCTNLLARGVSAVPLRLYRKKSAKEKGHLWKTKAVSKRADAWLRRKEGLQAWMRDGAEVEEVVEDHPFYTLWQCGNDLMTGSQLRRTLELHIDLVGGSYLHIIRDKGGLPLGLDILAPGTVKLKIENGELVGYVQEYMDEKNKLQTEYYTIEEICRPYVPHPANPLEGHSPTEAVGLSVQLGHDMQEFEAALMRNGGVPDTLVTCDKPVGPEAYKRFVGQWRQQYAGPRKRGKVGLLDNAEGYTVHQLGLTQKDMQFQEGRVVTRDEICNAFNVPVSFFTETATYDNAKMGRWSLAEYGIKPRLIILEDAFNRSIIPLYPDKSLFCAFDDPTPPDDEGNRKQAEIMLKSSGLVHKNEAREALGLGADPDMEGELIEAPAPASPFGATSVPSVPEETPASADESPEEEDEKLIARVTARLRAAGVVVPWANTEVVELWDCTDEEAKKAIVAAVTESPGLDYSDLCSRLRLGLKRVVELTAELEDSCDIAEHARPNTVRDFDALIAALEDSLGVEEAQRVLADIKAGRQTWIPQEDVKAELDLDDHTKSISAREWFGTLEAPCCVHLKEAPGVEDADNPFATLVSAWLAELEKDILEREQFDGVLFDMDAWAARLAVLSEVFVRRFLKQGVDTGLARVDRLVKAVAVPCRKCGGTEWILGRYLDDPEEALRDADIKRVCDACTDACGDSLGYTKDNDGNITLGKAVKVTAESFDMTYPDVAVYLQSEPLKFANSISHTLDAKLRAELLEGIEAGENTFELRKRVQKFSMFRDRKRAEMIARTEEARAMGRGELEAYRQSGVVGRAEWLASDDACEFCLALNGETVSVGGAFSPLGGAVGSVSDPDRTLMTDYETVVAPPLHPFCMCTIVPVLS